MPERKHADLWNRVVDEAGEDEIERAATVSAEQAKAELKGAGIDAATERAKANAFIAALENGTLGASQSPPSTPSAPATEAVSARSAPRSAPSAPRTVPTDAPSSGLNAPAPEAALPSAGAVPAAEKPPLASAASAAPTQPVPLPRVTRPPRPAFRWLAAAASFVAGGVLVAALESTLMSRSHPAREDLVAAAADLRHQATAACRANAWAVCLADIDQARALDPDGDEAMKGLREKAIGEILK
jgi:hypothetical protein